MNALLFSIWLSAATASTEAPASEVPPAKTPPAPGLEEVLQPDTKFEPPVVLSDTRIHPPDAARQLKAPVTVRVVIRVDASGEVAWVKLVEGAGAPFDALVLEAATHFRFSPARHEGQPVAVEIAFEQFFEAPEAPPVSETGMSRDAALVGSVIEKGTRRPLALTQVAITVAGEELMVETDSQGGFRVEIPSGRVRVEIASSDHRRFRVHEDLASNEELHVRYLVERLSYDPYETVVVGKRDRNVLSRTTLRDRELRQIPGTFGDPFRVVGTLPGVAQMHSLLAYPVVRGTSPGNTGFLLDGVRVPQLFHLFFGPAVIHPEFIDRLDFYAGGFPVNYGGYIGGIADGITRPVRSGESRVDVDVDLTKAGLFLRGNLDRFDSTATVAARYGYPFLLLDALNAQAGVYYWDYQVRLDHGVPGRGWRMFLMGAMDQLTEKPYYGPSRVSFRSQFHRLDLSYSRIEGRSQDLVRVVLGVDEILSGAGGSPTGDTGKVATWRAEPRLRLKRPLFDWLDLEIGADASVKDFSGRVALVELEEELEVDALHTAGIFAASVARVGEDLVIVPGIRADGYLAGDLAKGSMDPRLMARYRLTTHEAGELWLKAGVGRYHQPPRFLIPVPGLDDLMLQLGLLASTQVSIGVETPVHPAASVDLQVYYSHMDPLHLDLSFNMDNNDPGTQPRSPSDPPPLDSEMDPEPQMPFQSKIGRSYGMEVLLKRTGKGKLFGWLAYTLSWSERLRQAAWVPFDFDRRHMFHAVGGISLPRNWDFGLRLQIQSGRPVTTPEGFNAGRTPAFYRIDLRIDKTAVWNDWMLDFYVDLINVTLAAEQVDGDPASGFPYILPTIGFRAVL